MKKTKRVNLRREYQLKDLGKGVRGKYLKAYRYGTNLVLLEPKVAAAFPTERAVNRALINLMKADERAGITTHSNTSRPHTKTRAV